MIDQNFKRSFDTFTWNLPKIYKRISGLKIIAMSFIDDV